MRAFLVAVLILGGPVAGMAQETAAGWYDRQSMTPATQRRLGLSYRSCCRAGDVYRTRFRVIDDGSRHGTGQWQYWKGGDWHAVPPDVVERVETPTGQPVLFLSADGVPLCFKLPPHRG